MVEYKVDANLNSIEKGVNFLSQELNNLKCSKQEKVNAMLILEEVLALQIKNSDDTDIKIVVKKVFGNIKIKVSGKGNAVSIDDIKSNLFNDEEYDDEAKDVVNRLISKITGKSLSYKRVKDTNIYEISCNTNDLKSIYVIIGALMVGIVFGFAIKAISLSIANSLSANFFSPIYTMFINALKMIVGPLVFFSVSSSIADLSDLKALGRIALKIVMFYFFTSFLAIGVGFISSFIFPIGDPSLQSAITNVSGEIISNASNAEVSLLNTIINIIPTNIVTPFKNSDMLQIIFLAIIIGVATSIVGKDNYFLKFINSGNKVFSKVTSLIVKFMPFAIFCSMANLAISMDLNNIGKVALWIPAIVLGLVLMLVVYSLILLIVGRLNPIEFYKNYYNVMLTAITTNSSNATMPFTMKTCGEKLHISPKIYSFSIPLGATINMDGTSVTLAITALFAARIFEMPITGTMLTSLIICIISLSIGAPGVPGGGLICLALLLPSIGIPVETLSLIMGLYMIVGMLQTAINVTGDAVASLVVAKSEGLIEKNK